MAEELEGHTVKAVRWHVSTERYSFALEVVTKANRQMLIEFPAEGAVHLETCLRQAFEQYPEMREWTSPTEH